MKKILKFVFWCITISILLSAFPVFLAKVDFKKGKIQPQKIEEVIEDTENNNYNYENTLNCVNVVLDVGYTIIILLSGIFWFFMIVFLFVIVVSGMLDDSKSQKN